MRSMDWAQAGGMLISALIGVYGARAARKAERNSRPVSNGFTGYVLQDLREIRSILVDHLEAHGGASLRDTQQRVAQE